MPAISYTAPPPHNPVRIGPQGLGGLPSHAVTSWDDSLARLDAAADEAAQARGAGVQKFQHGNGSWTVSIEPTGGSYDDWAIVAEGATEAQVLSNLLAQLPD